MPSTHPRRLRDRPRAGPGGSPGTRLLRGARCIGRGPAVGRPRCAPGGTSVVRPAARPRAEGAPLDRCGRPLRHDAEARRGTRASPRSRSRSCRRLQRGRTTPRSWPCRSPPRPLPVRPRTRGTRPPWPDLAQRFWITWKTSRIRRNPTTSKSNPSENHASLTPTRNSAFTGNALGAGGVCRIIGPRSGLGMSMTIAHLAPEHSGTAIGDSKVGQTLNVSERLTRSRCTAICRGTLLPRCMHFSHS